MAVQVDRFTAVLVGTRQGGGSYVYSIGSIEGSCQDPAGADPTEIAEKPIVGIIVPAYNGAETVDALLDASLAVAQTACGAV